MTKGKSKKHKYSLIHREILIAKFYEFQIAGESEGRVQMAGCRKQH
jgi:hypothetical protein